jgi:hypothetical protein
MLLTYAFISVFLLAQTRQKIIVQNTGLITGKAEEKMHTFSLKFINSHLVITLDNHDWMLDTGAPNSFGDISAITIGDNTFAISEDYMGVNAVMVTELIGHTIAGIVGVDILNKFDVIFDIPQGQVIFSEEKLELDGNVLAIDLFMGIPLIQSVICDIPQRMFFDTGAQISYFQGDTLKNFPTAGIMKDFYPVFGEFTTETYLVDVALNHRFHTLRCGSLPDILGAMVQMGNSSGIIGNEIMLNRQIGYFPRRLEMVIA